MKVINTQQATYTVEEAGELLGLSRGNAYRAVRTGEIPAKRIGRRWVVPCKAFHAWLDDCDMPEAG